MPVLDVPVHTPSVPRRAVENGITVREDTLYTDAKGKERAKLRERASATLDALGEVLGHLLEPDEAVYYLAGAQVMPGAFQQLFLGWHTYALPRVVLVLTDRRVIVLRIHGKLSMGSVRWDRGVRTIRWGDLASAKAGGFISPYLRLKTKSGDSLSFWRISRADIKKLKLLAGFLQQQASGQTSPSGAPNALCPACLTTLVPRQYECPQCRLVFKDEKTLAWRGIFIPGGASFYAGLTGLGVLRAIFECVVLLEIVLELALAFESPAGSVREQGALGAAGFLLFLLILDKAIAIHCCRQEIRDFLPAAK